MRAFAGLCRWLFVGLILNPSVVTGASKPLVTSNLEDTTQSLFSPTHARIDVLVVLEGPLDLETAPVFRDIADTVQDGLHRLGHPSTIVYCTNIAVDNCFVNRGRLVVLAAHNLASFVTADGRSAVLEKNILPPEAVLYNFEQVPRYLPLTQLEASGRQSEGRNRSLINANTLEIYARFKLWDYSEENVRRLVAMGIHAELVPLGFSSKLRPSYSYSDGVRQYGGHESIDVLFIGMETPTRQATIHRLRDAGITVVHPNSAGTGLFGAEFDAISARSKIVLSLNAFEKTEKDCSRGSDALCNEAEWKMPRLARLLANGRFVVSEMSGSAVERARLSGGVVFVEPERLAETCQYYLTRPALRVTIAERGRQLFERQLEADILRQPVERIFGEPTAKDRSLTDGGTTE